MGMFDSIYIDIECPYCGEISNMDCQTKDTNCLCDIWKKDEYIGTDKFDFLSCMGACMSRKCVEYVDKETGYHSGFGRMFRCNVFLDKGYITGEYEITELVDK